MFFVNVIAVNRKRKKRPKNEIGIQNDFQLKEFSSISYPHLDSEECEKCEIFLQYFKIIFLALGTWLVLEIFRGH